MTAPHVHRDASFFGIPPPLIDRIDPPTEN